MSTVDDLKNAFAGNRGKVLAIGGGAIVVYLWWTRGRTPSTPQPVDTTPDGLHRTASVPAGETTAGPGANTRPTNNAEWQDRAVQILGGPPYNYSETAVYNAIAKAFLGEPITAQEENWIRDAMRSLGSPPEGIPPLNIGAPTGNPQTPAPAAQTLTVWAHLGNTVSGVASFYGVSEGEIWALNPDLQSSLGQHDSDGFLSASNPPGPGPIDWVFGSDTQIKIPKH